MKIRIIISEAELADEGITAEELKRRVVEDLDGARDYPGFYAEVEVRSASGDEGTDMDHADS